MEGDSSTRLFGRITTCMAGTQLADESIVVRLDKFSCTCLELYTACGLTIHVDRLVR